MCEMGEMSETSFIKREINNGMFFLKEVAGLEDNEVLYLLKELFESFVIYSNRIEEEAEKENIEELRRQLHTIVGAAGNFRIETIVCQAKAIREAAISGKFEEMNGAVVVLKKYVNGFLIEFQKMYNAYWV